MEDNLATLFQNRTFRFRHKPIVSYKRDQQWVPLTWEQLGHQVERTGRALIHTGVKPQDKVAIISTNRPEWIVADLAILSIGAVSVPIYPNSTPAQAKYILDHAEVKVVFASESEGKNILNPIKDELPRLQKIVSFENLEEFDKLADEIEPVAFYERIQGISPHDLATLVYTSGTTGDPKGVMLTHKNILANATAAAEVFPISQSDHCLSFLPLSHALERTAGFFTMLHVGVRISFAESLTKIFQNLKEVKPTIIVSVPRILEKFYSRIQSDFSSKPKFVRTLFQSRIHQKIRDEMGGELKYIVCGGAAMSPDIGQFFKKVGLSVLEGYGLTEASPIVSVNLPSSEKMGTVGKPLPGVEVKIAGDGEVLVKGPNVMKGYFKDSTSTSDVFSEDGFLKTGDIGLMEAGFLKLTDRKKEILVTSGGKNIAPTPIENLLKTYPLVEHACVVGDHQKYLAALIVPNFSLLEQKASARSIDVQDRETLCSHPEVRAWYQKIVEEVNAKLAAYESLKKFAILTEDFSVATGEITPTLKLKRKVINSKFREKIDELFK